MSVYLCQQCAESTKPHLLTGFCMLGKCQSCGAVGDVAVAKPNTEGQSTLAFANVHPVDKEY
jgi:hypothetical protein